MMGLFALASAALPSSITLATTLEAINVAFVVGDIAKYIFGE